MSRRWFNLLGWLFWGALLGGLSLAVDGLLLGLLGGVVFTDDPVPSGLLLAFILGVIGAMAGALLGAAAWYLLPKLVLPPPNEARRTERKP